MSLLHRIFGWERREAPRPTPPVPPGVCEREFYMDRAVAARPKDVRVGMRCQFVSWEGCMAEIREDGPVGTVIEVEVRPHPQADMSVSGILVKLDLKGRPVDDDTGMRWHSFDDLWIVDGRLEVWR